MTTHSSGRRFGVRSVYTLAGEWGTGSHPLALPSIDVSRQSTGFEKTMRLKASKSDTSMLGRTNGWLAVPPSLPCYKQSRPAAAAGLHSV